MFESARKEVDSRYDGALQLFNAVCSTKGQKPYMQRMKGLAFVEMYAFYEYAVHAAVKMSLTTIRNADLSIPKLAPCLQGLLLDSNLQSISESKKQRQWSVRSDLFRGLQSETTAATNVDLFPDDGSHYRRSQLETIWLVLGVHGQIVPDDRIFPLIGEVVEHRNAIAHGRERPEDIGRGYSAAEIRRKLKQFRRLCRDIVNCCV